MRIFGNTEKWAEKACRCNKKNDDELGELSTVEIEVRVSSTVYGKTIAIYDPNTGYSYAFDGDLVAYWLEHGTEGD